MPQDSEPPKKHLTPPANPPRQRRLNREGRTEAEIRRLEGNRLAQQRMRQRAQARLENATQGLANSRQEGVQLSNEQWEILVEHQWLRLEFRLLGFDVYHYCRQCPALIPLGQACNGYHDDFYLCYLHNGIMYPIV